MKDLISKRITILSEEIQALHNEREAMLNRDREIEVRLHQLVGAIYEMQNLIAHLDRQPSAEEQVADSEVPAADPQQTDQKSDQT